LERESTVRVGLTLPGQVVAVSAEPGDNVVRGQVLARLENLEQRAAVEVAEAQLAAEDLGLTQARKRFLEALEPSGYFRHLMAPDEVLEGPAGDAQLEVLAAAIRLKRQDAYRTLARGLLARRSVRAPADGVVVSRSFDRGETAQASPPGPPLFVIDTHPGRLVLRAKIDDEYVSRLRATVARVVVPSAERSLVGEVIGMNASDSLPGSRRIDGGPRYEVQIAIEKSDGTLRPGESGTVELPMSSPSRSLRVLSLAVSRSPDSGLEPKLGSQGNVVWVTRGLGPPTPVPVETGVNDGTYVEIRGPGLSAGSMVVIHANGGVR
jgi:HlyD family secretion protein